MKYEDLISRKLARFSPVGFEYLCKSPHLFDFQRALVEWATRIGRAAIFADTGLGKTRMQLQWADAVARKTGGSVLILAPLAVADQTCEEGAIMGVAVNHLRDTALIDGICITNYERLHKFDVDGLAGVVLDESSCIKHHDAKTFTRLTEAFRDVPYKLCATATPAPNDWTELGTHAEFLGVCSRAEMLAEFFIHDAAKTQDWRLKGHAKQEFWRWVASWGCVVRNPGDIGFDGSKYDLPDLRVNQHTVVVEKVAPDGQLFQLEASSLSERRDARRNSIDARVQKCADKVNADRQPWVVWCELNAESDALVKAIDGAIEVRGSQTLEEKEKALSDFAHGRVRVLVTKPSIAGFGLNWQHCARMAFVGVTDSYESYYQAVRRCWRFGQTRSVHVHVFASDLEGSVVSNLQRKDDIAKEMAKEMAAHTADAVRHNLSGLGRWSNEYNDGQSVKIPRFICAA